jgi:hypothetical protein
MAAATAVELRTGIKDMVGFATPATTISFRSRIDVGGGMEAWKQLTSQGHCGRFPRRLQHVVMWNAAALAAVGCLTASASCCYN